MKPIPYPILVHDRQAYIERAHRIRATVVADAVRSVVRWVARASH